MPPAETSPRRRCAPGPGPPPVPALPRLHCHGPRNLGEGAAHPSAVPLQTSPLALKDGPPGPETGEGQEGLRCVLGAASQACSTKPKGLRFRFVFLRVSFDGRLKAAVCTRASGRAGGAPGVQAWQVQSRNQDSGQPPDGSLWRWHLKENEANKSLCSVRPMCTEPGTSW